MDINVLLEKALEETKRLYDKETFLVKDLFKGYIWNRIPRKDRLLLGTLFLNHINTFKEEIKIVEKNSSGQQRYMIDKSK